MSIRRALDDVIVYALTITLWALDHVTNGDLNEERR